MQLLNNFTKLFALTTLILLGACATQVTETPTPAQASSVPLSEFSKVILVEAEMAPIYAGQGANEKAARKINQILEQQTRSYLSNVERVSLEEYQTMDFASADEKEVLVIKPYIKQIKFIGGAARFFAGAMAGSSVVIMDTVFSDAASKQVIGKTGSYRKASAYGDGFGIASNRMLEDVAVDVGVYISGNRN